METMLALCVVCEVLCIPENFRTAVVRTIKTVKSTNSPQLQIDMV
jgi:hypothetical protein